MSNDDVAILLEEIVSQNKAVLEIVGDMQKSMGVLAKQSDLEEVKSDVKIVKAAITDTNKDMQHIDRRVTDLEAA